ncbi:MAG: 2OG-Fe(II) oxygenase family protein [Gammaproteobacteria bacterium]|nr:2OG-Fe(II) oxygenase family protein [Gammaproteobacteria bacterium]MCW8988424.1 2OG-Fe(II) oxygenase family protein [Gammaproteobacteria bacterium]MCW9030027.1 2OG-Fe(II) oxygenase family protein [Gammaproteobacteria bacterium]
MSKDDQIYKDKIKVRGKSINIWPAKTEVLEISDSPMTYLAHFDDIEKYHDKLKERILELEKEESHTHRFKIGGSKVRYVHEWGTAESKLINARATAFFCQAVGRSNAVITASWASISRKNEYLAGHSHDDCIASVVYMLEPGNGKNENGLDGKFAITDPRVPGCCNKEEGRVTMEVSPDMKPGAMIIFPSELVHHVHPYTGDEPRITLAWNFKLSEK